MERFARIVPFQESIESTDRTAADETELSTHSCTQQELENHFEYVEDYVERHWDKFRCVDNSENVAFMGDYWRSIKREAFGISVEKCKQDCAGEEEFS